MNTKQHIGAISLEKYVQKGKLPQCLPIDVSITLEQAKVQADEVWSVEGEKLEVISMDYEGYTVNMTFQTDGNYLFDSVDVWEEEAAGVGQGTEPSKLVTLRTAEGMQCFASDVGIKLEWFDLGDERVCLLPSAVTLHYLKRKNEWKLVKIAGAYRSLEQVRGSLRSIADAMN